MTRRFVRHQGREHALVTHLMARMGTPHVWGACDCWTLVIDTVRILANVSEKALRVGVPPYDTLAGAVRASMATGGISTMLRTWGLAIQPHTHPIIGDIAVCQTGAPFESALIAMGNGRYLGVTEGGVVGWCPPLGSGTLYRVA